MLSDKQTCAKHKERHVGGGVVLNTVKYGLMEKNTVNIHCSIIINSYNIYCIRIDVTAFSVQRRCSLYCDEVCTEVYVNYNGSIAAAW